MLGGIGLSGLVLLRRRTIARWLFGCLVVATPGAARWAIGGALSRKMICNPLTTPGSGWPLRASLIAIRSNWTERCV
jgi:hypothetical protein